MNNIAATINNLKLLKESVSKKLQDVYPEGTIEV